MYKILRIIFCILAATGAAVTLFIFLFFGLWGFLPLGATIIFAALMFVCKNAQTSEELKANPPPPQGDFITGKVNREKKDEEIK